MVSSVKHHIETPSSFRMIDVDTVSHGLNLHLGGRFLTVDGFGVVVTKGVLLVFQVVPPRGGEEVNEKIPSTGSRRWKRWEKTNSN